jgi:Flp pilus assembly protein TadG
MILQPVRAPRRGAIAPFAAILVVVLIGMVAFAVDTGYIVLTRTELQSAADAAALAGADPLMSASIQYQMAAQNPQNAVNDYQTIILNSAMRSARAQAKQYAADNGAGGVSSLTLSDSDIEFGYMDASYNYTAYDANNPVFPNTIKVTLRRDSSANGTLGLFFAPVIGTSNVDVTATASATLMGGAASNFNTSITGQNIKMLPLAYDVNAWNNFVKTGQWPDGTVYAGANGLPDLQVYPFVNNVGNFDWISLNQTHVGASTLWGWVQNGMAPSDVTALQSGGVIPLSSHPANTWDWVGDTGFKSSDVQSVNQYIGTTFLLPLFNPYNSSAANYTQGVGTGSGFTFDIVQFVGVKIVRPPQLNQQVFLQPSMVLDPSVVFTGGAAPVDTVTGGTSITTTFSYPRLSR